jgi:uncharacterized membrane protein
MPALYFVNITMHVLAAVLWIGGMLFLGIVGAPLLRALEPPELRQRLFRDLGLRFRTVGWWSIAVLIVTGFVNLAYRDLLRWDGVLGSAGFWRTSFGHVLAIKLLAVAVMLTVSAVHDFVIGPAASAATPGSPESATLRRRAALIARVNALIGVIVVVAAVRLAR